MTMTTPVTPSSVCDMQGESLKPCPFCGSGDIKAKRGKTLMLECQGCGVVLINYKDGIQRDPYEVWNRRAALAERTQQEAQPVAWMYTAKDQSANPMVMRQPMSAGAMARDLWDEHPLYTRPTSAADCTAKIIPCNCEFDAWQQNPYTKVLMKSISEDYVPKADCTAPMQPSEAMNAEVRGILDRLEYQTKRADMWMEKHDALEKALAAPTQAAPAAQAGGEAVAVVENAAWPDGWNVRAKWLVNPPPMEGTKLYAAAPTAAERPVEVPPHEYEAAERATLARLDMLDVFELASAYETLMKRPASDDAKAARLTDSTHRSLMRTLKGAIEMGWISEDEENEVRAAIAASTGGK